LKTLEEIIIERGDIEKIYHRDWNVTLWRAMAIDSIHGGNPLYPDLTNRVLPNGDIRRPDVSVYTDEQGVQRVKAQEGRGTSLSDKEGTFGFKKWGYIAIPAGTLIPNGLIITRDHFLASKGCWHYSISPNQDMPVDDLLHALDQFAKNAKIQITASRRHA
jgi:hypothetical protein